MFANQILIFTSKVRNWEIGNWFLFADQAFSGPQMMGLGVLMMITAILLRRSFKQNQNSRERNLNKELQSELREVDHSARGIIQKLELRLYEYEREVEAKFQTQRLQLDALLNRAEEVLAELRNVQQQNTSSKKPSIINSASQQLIVDLQQSGYSAAEIATILSITETEVAGALHQFKRDAA